MTKRVSEDEFRSIYTAAHAREGTRMVCNALRQVARLEVPGDEDAGLFNNMIAMANNISNAAGMFASLSAAMYKAKLSGNTEELALRFKKDCRDNPALGSIILTFADLCEDTEVTKLMRTLLQGGEPEADRKDEAQDEKTEETGEYRIVEGGDDEVTEMLRKLFGKR